MSSEAPGQGGGRPKEPLYRGDIRPWGARAVAVGAAFLAYNEAQTNHKTRTIVLTALAIGALAISFKQQQDLVKEQKQEQQLLLEPTVAKPPTLSNWQTELYSVIFLAGEQPMILIPMAVSKARQLGQKVALKLGLILPEGDMTKF